jgi:hypothetical protein
VVEETRNSTRKGREQSRRAISGPIQIVPPSEDASLRSGNHRFFSALDEEAAPIYNPWSDEYKIPRISVTI